jgi:hypothetical protein
LGFTGKESLTVQKFLDNLGNVLPIHSRVFDVLKAQKSTSLVQPELSKCSINLSDAHFGSIELTYFPEDWKWGEPHKIMMGSLFLEKVTLRNPLLNLTKPGPSYGSGIGLHLQGNVEITDRAGFMKSRIVGYQFRAVKKENGWLAERINYDRVLLDSLNREFSTGKSRPLPSIGAGGTIIPFGGFDIFDIDGQKEKVVETDFWKISEPTTPEKLVRRLNVLRNLANYLREPGSAPPPLPRPLRRRTVLWDMAHNETLRASFEKVVNTLQSDVNISWGPILGEWREECLAEKSLVGWPAVLVLGGIESEGKLANAEIQNIVNFVEVGGALLITAPCTLYSLADTNKLSSRFGFSFLAGKAQDAVNYEGKHKDHSIIRDFRRHPITEGLMEICFGDYGGTTIKPEQEGMELLAFTSEKAIPAKAPVLACISRGKGMVVAFGCSSTFDDKNLGKLDNLKFMKNVFEYLSCLEPIQMAVPSSSLLPPPPPPPPPPEF